jgi:hypothetical protein
VPTGRRLLEYKKASALRALLAGLTKLGTSFRKRLAFASLQTAATNFDRPANSVRIASAFPYSSKRTLIGTESATIKILIHAFLAFLITQLSLFLATA